MEEKVITKIYKLKLVTTIVATTTTATTVWITALTWFFVRIDHINYLNDFIYNWYILNFLNTRYFDLMTDKTKRALDYFKKTLGEDSEEYKLLKKVLLQEENDDDQ